MERTQRLDVLFAAHHPDRDTNDTFRQTLNDRATAREIYNHRARKQPPYTEDEMAILSRWRTATTRHINERISQYSLSRCTQDEHVQPPARPTTAPTSSHKALRIPELLEYILEFADAEGQISAWFVSKEWRQSATSIITSHLFRRFWDPPAARVPVEYGAVIDGNSDIWNPPTNEEVELFSYTFTQSMQRVQRGTMPDDGGRPLVSRKTLYFPARYTQATNLPTALSVDLDNLDDSQHRRLEGIYGSVHFGPMSRHPHRYWLDFSQFEINPYFTALFPGQIACVNGRIELGLRSDVARSLLVNSFVSTKAFDFLGPMFLTNPPCRAVGIYHYADTRFLPNNEYLEVSNKELLVRVQNDKGVKLKEIIAALIRHAPRVLASWLEQASTLRDKVATGHWQEDVWRVPGHPRFILLLDSTAMEQEWTNDRELRSKMQNAYDAAARLPDPFIYLREIPMPRPFCGHITRLPYLMADGFREERQGEWVPKELIEPAVSNVRYPVNWDR